MLEFYIKSTGPKSHIQICEIISITGMEILHDSFGDSEVDGYYGMFHVKGTEEAFELASDFPDFIIELPPGKVLR